MNGDVKRLVIVSNRLPVVLGRDDAGWTIRPGEGGLVTALAPVLRNRGGVWIGWPGCSAPDAGELRSLLQRGRARAGYDLEPVLLTEEEKEGFYDNFSNGILWPLFHNLPAPFQFQPNDWQHYRNVNRKFAEAVAAQARPGDYIWVHDYHLMNVARELREMNVENRVGFFLHIPFPPLDVFLRLPWRFEILKGLLDYELIGFQTLRDRRNFVQCVRTLLGVRRYVGKGQVLTAQTAQRSVRIGSFPIGIDFEEFSRQAVSDEAVSLLKRLRHEFSVMRVVLGVDRLDYTKGIPNRFHAFHQFLKKNPEQHRKVRFIQVVVPSRESVPTYLDVRREIDGIVGQINGQFTQPGWVPVHYFFRSLTRAELVAYYRLADVAFITPLRDGMNLVAKEYAACRVENEGVLILSEFAGAVDQLQRGALVVNPFDIEGMADTLVRAVEMPVREQRSRMRRLRRAVREQNIFWWVDAFLRAAFEHDLDDFPLLDTYLPSDEQGYSSDLSVASAHP
jgi:trehalose 6-phosphate synthase/phosphatase